MANATNNEADWIPLMDYAIKNGVSLSTLRRHIKANKITYKVENGRYLLRSDEPAAPASTQSGATASTGASAAARANASATAPAGATSAASEVSELRNRLKKAQEEIADLKMLVAIYEEQLGQTKNPSGGEGHPPRTNKSMRING